MTGICQKIAQWCRENGEVTEQEYPVLVYGLQVMTNSSVKIAGILLIGLCLGRFCEVLLSVAVFGSMRYWTGGFHCKTHLGCFTAMLFPCLLPSFLISVEGDWVYLMWGVMWVCAVYEILRYAPRNSKVNPITDPKILRRNRVCGIVECAVLFMVFCVCGDWSVRWLVSVPIFVDGMLLAPVLNK